MVSCFENWIQKTTCIGNMSNWRKREKLQLKINGNYGLQFVERSWALINGVGDQWWWLLANRESSLEGGWWRGQNRFRTLIKHSRKGKRVARREFRQTISQLISNNKINQNTKLCANNLKTTVLHRDRTEYDNNIVRVLYDWHPSVCLETCSQGLTSM